MVKYVFNETTLCQLGMGEASIKEKLLVAVLHKVSLFPPCCVFVLPAEFKKIAEIEIFLVQATTN